VEKLRKLFVINSNGQELGMEFDQIAVNVTDFFQTHQLISILALVVVVCLFFQSPKESFKFLVFLTIVAIAGYFVLQLSSPADTGVSTKKELVHKTKKALDD
jgi:hypothetical protein